MSKRERWRSIKGYEKLYEISDRGQVRSLRHYPYKTMKQQNVNGYWWVSLYKDGDHKTHRVHRLVTIAFLPNPNKKPFVNHLDGDRGNNNLSNLEWSTLSENMLHAFNVLHPFKMTDKRKKHLDDLIEIALSQSKKIFCPEDEILFSSINAAARHYGLNKTTIKYRLKVGGPSKFGKSFIYYKEGKQPSKKH